MDPTLTTGAATPNMPGAAAPAMPTPPTTQQAMQNAMLLQAIQSGAPSAGGAAPGPTSAAMGPAPMGGGPSPAPPMPPPTAMPTPPVDPSTMAGGLGQVPTSQANPVVSALMSQIPTAGGQ
jgi:hypothetical protein